jgi:hypothetical protein
MSIRDIFEPSHQPAKSIYDAFQNEAMMRRGRTAAEWTTAEVNRVHIEAVYQAQIHGLRAPTLEEVVAVEKCARGHIDYGAKWAYGVVERMRKSNLAAAK